MLSYALICKLGQGAYGIVLKARVNEDGRLVAIKRVAVDAGRRLEILREVSTLRNAQHPNIVSLIDVQCSRDTVSIVLEFVETTLKEVILDWRRPRSEAVIAFFFHQLVKAVVHLHSLHIMHRDLKPENVLISVRNELKVTDFGQAALFFPDKPLEYKELVATRWYRAPELLFRSPFHTPAVDCWALGCILAEFHNAAVFFPGRNDLEQVSRVFEVLGTPTAESWPDWQLLPDTNKVIFDEALPKEDWSCLLPGASSDVLTEVRSLLVLCPERRKTAKELLVSPFLANRPEKMTYRAREASPPRRPHYDKDVDVASLFA